MARRSKFELEWHGFRVISGHADRDQLLELVANGSNKAKQIFVTMGRNDRPILTQRIRDYLGLNAIALNKTKKWRLTFSLNNVLV